MGFAVQLPLLSHLSLDQWATEITGCWSAGERILSNGSHPLSVNVWFHFFEGGVAMLSMRYRDGEEPSRVHGSWHLNGQELSVSFGEGIIQAPLMLQDDIIQWAGETLIRLPDEAASVPFGIKLPYRRSLFNSDSPSGRSPFSA